MQARIQDFVEGGHTLEDFVEWGHTYVSYVTYVTGSHTLEKKVIITG